MQKLVAMMAFAGLLALPGAMAAYVSTGDLTGAFAEATGVAIPVYYLNDDGTVWEETNGYAGLQTSPIVDELGNPLAPADTNAAAGVEAPGEVPGVGVPEMPGAPEMPAFPELPGLPL